MSTSWSAKKTSSRKSAARATFVEMRIQRRSNMSTKTPAMAPKTTAGTRNVSSRTLTAVLELVSSLTVTVRPKSAMLPPTWLRICEPKRARNLGLPSTRRAWSRSAPPSTVMASSTCSMIVLIVR